MAGKLKPENMTAEAYADFRIASAWEAVAASDDLRFLFRSILTQCGWATTPVASTVEGTFKLCGRHEIGTELIQSMLENVPNLYPNLIKDDRHEQTLPHNEHGKNYADDVGSG